MKVWYGIQHPREFIIELVVIWNILTMLVAVAIDRWFMRRDERKGK